MLRSPFIDPGRDSANRTDPLTLTNGHQTDFTAAETTSSRQHENDETTAGSQSSHGRTANDRTCPG